MNTSRPFADPLTNYEWGPDTALTPKLTAHGSQSNFRILKGNPIGIAMGDDGYMSPFLSAKMENYSQPLEHAMLNSVELDTYGLGQKAPLMQPPQQRRYLQPSVQFQWPDTSISQGYSDPDILDSQGKLERGNLRTDYQGHIRGG